MSSILVQKDTNTPLFHNANYFFNHIDWWRSNTHVELIQSSCTLRLPSKTTVLARIITVPIARSPNVWYMQPIKGPNSTIIKRPWWIWRITGVAEREWSWCFCAVWWFWDPLLVLLKMHGRYLQDLELSSVWLTASLTPINQLLITISISFNLMTYFDQIKCITLGVEDPWFASWDVLSLRLFQN